METARAINTVAVCSRCGSHPMIEVQNGKMAYAAIHCNVGHSQQKVVKFSREEDTATTLRRCITQWNDLNSDYE